MERLNVKQLVIATVLSLGGSALMSFAGGAWGASHELTQLKAEVQTLKATDIRMDADLKALAAGKLDIRQHDELVKRIESWEAQNSEDHRKIMELLTVIAQQRGH